MLAPSTVIEIAAAEVVAGAEDDALAAMHIHGIGSDLAGHFGAMVLGDGRGYRRFFAAVNRGSGGLRQSAGCIGIAGNARQGFFDAFKAADGQPELLADARIGAGHHGGQFGRAAGGCRQGDRAADRQAFDQHAPALADVIFAADQL